jgi:hypothetical protein
VQCANPPHIVHSRTNLSVFPMPEGFPVRTQLVVLLVLLADLEAFIALEPAVWVPLTIITMAAVAVLVVRISRCLIRSIRKSNDNA